MPYMASSVGGAGSAEDVGVRSNSSSNLDA